MWCVRHYLQGIISAEIIELLECRTFRTAALLRLELLELIKLKYFYGTKT